MELRKKDCIFFRADEKGRLSHNRSGPGTIVGSASAAAAVLPRLLGEIGILRFFWAGAILILRFMPYTFVRLAEYSAVFR